jgi:hypothetical protein
MHLVQRCRHFGRRRRGVSLAQLARDLDEVLGWLARVPQPLIELGRMWVEELSAGISMLAPFARFLASDEQSSHCDPSDELISMRAYRESDAYEAFRATDWNVSTPAYFVPDSDSGTG